MNKRKLTWQAILIIIAIAVVWFAIKATIHTVSETEVSVDVDQTINITPEQIESIKAIGEWEFLSIADEEMVDTVRKGIFSDDQLVRIYYGTVRLGINMHQVGPGWIKASGDSIEVTLPKIGLLDRDFIDEARTKSFHESGRWKAADREALYRKAYKKMLKRCMTPENIKNAKHNGEEQFRHMMKTMGYTYILINWEK